MYKWHITTVCVVVLADAHKMFVACVIDTINENEFTFNIKFYNNWKVSKIG